MQDISTKTTPGDTAAISNLVTLFKPRQLLLNSNTSTSTMKNPQIKTPKFSLNDEQRVLLFQSICHFFELNGFSKSLKKFSKEANIEKESWKSCLVNLEEMCCHFLKTRNVTKVSESAIKEQATNESVETIKKTKKNEGDEGMKSQEKLKDTPIVDEKPKKKKKSKSASESSEQIAEENDTKPSNEPEDVSLSVPNEPEKKSKDKKKKRKEESQEEKKEEIAGEMSEKADVSQDKKKWKSKSKKKKEDDLKFEDSSVSTGVDNEKKSSKKRKSSSEENGNGDIENELLGETKRRKTDNFDQSNEIIAPKTPNGSSNGILENGETKVSQKKEKSKQRNGSAEPKSATNAFRRVKEEEVEFVDEKLQDNSYWAKDGADTGYGAKAQEVLGQVRGRGFRHEKTKKKRGSYRGGQIDLQSHSFKFNYDDDDE